ncbi:ATP-binding protein [Methanothermococcus okinawensis]|uniref:AAA ATPase n=1 Tax=Methanothermococcus okinawensis (strain DSM 14208 / JCM 11175 / IH1) TaxID=647113 RepID=F8AJT3_METOI|nr:ATP-binding protein [Methanothermococcus okinawensis]AEH07281.1 AAA ATPase [Methanothermococcus okinawensis IH1]
MKFFNREKEIKEITSILEGEPNQIYFIYGSINSGKTTLINHIINNKLDDNYKVFYINFRTYLISEKKDFIEAIFSTKKDDFLETIKDKSEVLNLITKGARILTGVPIPEVEFNKLFEERINDAFQYLNNIMLETRKNGKTPILILDELQMIKDITTNGQKYLLKELFQFLVSLTKEQHLCHVFCLTSDSLFAEYVYNTGELEGRAKHLLVDDFDKETSLRFMDFLAKEILNKPELPKEQKEQIYSLVGGKPADIYNIIDEIRYKKLDDILNQMLKVEVSKLNMFLEIMEYSKPKIEIGNNIIEINKKDVLNALKLFKNKYKIPIKEISLHIYSYLIKENILFLNPTEETLKPQSFLVWNAIKRVV